MYLSVSPGMSIYADCEYNEPDGLAFLVGPNEY